jgi:hypothetical protein
MRKYFRPISDCGECKRSAAAQEPEAHLACKIAMKIRNE